MIFVTHAATQTTVFNVHSKENIHSKKKKKSNMLLAYLLPFKRHHYKMFPSHMPFTDNTTTWISL